MKNEIASKLKEAIRLQRYWVAIMLLKQEIKKLILQDIQKNYPEIDDLSYWEMLSFCKEKNYPFIHTFLYLNNSKEDYTIEEVTSLIQTYEIIKEKMT